MPRQEERELDKTEDLLTLCTWRDLSGPKLYIEKLYIEELSEQPARADYEVSFPQISRLGNKSILHCLKTGPTALTRVVILASPQHTHIHYPNTCIIFVMLSHLANLASSKQGATSLFSPLCPTTHACRTAVAGQAPLMVCAWKRLFERPRPISERCSVVVVPRWFSAVT